MRPPAFWHDPKARLAPLLLSPLGCITAAATWHRLRQPGFRAPVPVICCGNAGVGGAGKTTLVLDLLQRLRSRGIEAHALTRGYGGTSKGVLQVDAVLHHAAVVGDEALLLAARAPTWVAADRAASARSAVAQGAECLVMDDGLQNPSLVKDCTLLVIDGEAGFGNARLLPAGPLRESVARAAARSHAAVLIGADRRHARSLLPPGLPVLRATLAMAPEAELLRGQRLVAFAGIGRPDKFFDALDAIGLQLVARHGFADHHRYSAATLDRLAATARQAGARLVTTPKDAVRLPSGFRERVVALAGGLRWQDDVEPLLDRVLAHRRSEAVNG